jgi:hypothetical protein
LTVTLPAATRTQAGASASGWDAARLVVNAFIVAMGVLAVVLLVTSLLPTSVLAGRLLGAVGEADRSGAHTRDLLDNFGQRLRFAGVCAAALAIVFWISRDTLSSMLKAARVDAGASLRMQLDRRDVISVGLVMFLALGLRLAFVAQPMRYDESLTFNELASRPLYYGLSYYPDPNNHLLNTLLVHIAYAVLGNQPWVLRLPALVAGVLLAPATYALGRALYGSRGAAVLAAALVATSSYVIEYSTNSRGYTLQALCFVVMLGLVHIGTRRSSASALLLAAVIAALGAYALPTMLYGVVIAVAWVLVGIRRVRPRFAQLAVVGTLIAALVFLLYLPVVLISGPESLSSNRFVAPLTLPEFADQLPASLRSTWAFWNRDVLLPIAVLLVLGFAVRTVIDVRVRRVPLGVLAVAVCLVLVGVQRVAPFERVWIFLMPLYFAIAAAGFGRLAWVGAPIVAAIGAFAVLTSGSVLESGETGTFPEAEAVAMALQGRVQAEDAVVTTLPTSLPELQYYFPRAGLPTGVLVRTPDQAAHLSVVTSTSKSPTIAGWGEPRTLATAGDARVLELARQQ